MVAEPDFQGNRTRLTGRLVLISKLFPPHTPHIPRDLSCEWVVIWVCFDHRTCEEAVFGKKDGFFLFALFLCFQWLGWVRFI